MTAVWVITGLLTAVVIYMRGWVKGRAHGIAEGTAESEAWRDQCDAFEAELTTAQAQLAKRDQAIVDLQHNIGVVWDAGVMAGQTFQADRQENDL